MTRYLRTLAAVFAALAMAAFGPRDGQAQEHGGLAFGYTDKGVAWAFDVGNSVWAAEAAAQNRCVGLLGAACQNWGVFDDSCAAIAVSACPASSCSRPSYGFSTGPTRNEASTGAIAQCERGARGAGVSGTCRVATSDQGQPGVMCVGTADVDRPQTVRAQRLPPGPAVSAGWGSLAFGTTDRRVAWAFDVGERRSDALSKARVRCGRLLGSFCSTRGTFSESCYAVAVSECPESSCLKPAYGFAGGSTEQEAGTGAIEQCERGAGGSPGVSGTCRVATSDEGEPGVMCVRAGEAPEEGPAIAHEIGSVFRDCPHCPELVVVPSGSFTMGSPASEEGRRDREGPQLRVTIGSPFAVGVYEVTFDEWDACVSGGGCGGYRPDDEGWGRGRRPVINVRWDDAQSYVSWLSRETGENYRLLSESEWEYVARAGTETRYWWGDAIGRNRANCGGNSCGDDYSRTSPVGSFRANRFGLHDVHGNVIEWVEDCWNDSYAGAPVDGSAWERGECAHRVLRGGNWNYVLPKDLRAARRFGNDAGYWSNGWGFRVARTFTP